MPGLPAYVSNGLVGLRIMDIPLLPGMAMVSGFAGLHPVVQVEAGAPAPYPLAGDLSVDRVWLSAAVQEARFAEQRYDFECGEVTTRFAFTANGVTATATVLTFASREEPTLVLQEVAIEVDAACDLVLRAIVDPAQVSGRMGRRDVGAPGSPKQIAEGSMCWESLGGVAKVGIAYWTELLGIDAEKKPVDLGIERPLATDYQIRAVPGRTYQLRQIASVVASVVHPDPDREATRLVSRAAKTGFDALRAANREMWADLWRSRVLITAEDPLWQGLADAAFFYLNASAHRSSPASTSIFGLAQWRDYHYYYGHVMWDIEAFAVPALEVSQPAAAAALLAYRSRNRPSAAGNALLNGRAGLQFPWESSPMTGSEASPGVGSAGWYEDHGNLDVAHAFALHANATGDAYFLREAAAPVLYGVADWLATRAVRRNGGYSIPRTMGIAEREVPADNDAFTVMAAKTVLAEAIDIAERLDDPIPEEWRRVARGLDLRTSETTGAILSHDGFHPDETKAATPGPPAGFFPLGFEVAPELERATIRYFLDKSPDYIGSPMLSAFYGVWAAWIGDREGSDRFFRAGYADLVGDRFRQTLEHLPSRYPEKPAAGPFMANLAGFLCSLVYGLPGIRVGPGDPSSWPVRKVILPAGWRRIEIERAWFRRRATRLVAEHGADRATLEADEAEERRSVVAVEA